MKLEYIAISKLCQELGTEKLHKTLCDIPALRAELARIDDKKDSSKKLESLAGLYLLSKMQSLDNAFIKRDENGRPFAEGDDFDFNISHSEGLAVCAVSSTRVGVDTELIRPLPRQNELAARYFCENERASIALAKDRDEEFFRIWTRKEAYLKLTGEGLKKSLPSIDTTALAARFLEKTVKIGNDRYIISAIEL